MYRILIVEDEIEIRQNLEILINSEGYETFSAGDGLEALKLIETMRPDLIISDIMIPYIDGLQLFNQIKANVLTMNIPFIFLTANFDESSIKMIEGSGQYDFIKKPFSADDLINLIKFRLPYQKS